MMSHTALRPLMPCAGLLLLLAAAAAWGQAGIDDSSRATTSTPAVAPPDGARETDRSREERSTYPLITDRIAQRGGVDGNIGATRTVEGVLSKVTYRMPADTTAKAIAHDYEERLAAAGFDVIYRCAGEACGATFVRASPGYRSHPDLFDAPLSAQRYLAARRMDSSGDVYAAIQLADTGRGTAVQIDTLRVTPREISAIAVNAEQMARDLTTTGRAALYGISFDTDSARIKPDSKPTLDEVAKLLRERPRLRLLVVGHTDSRGSFDYNIELSTNRAQAVVAALVDDYGIDRSRLKPWGVGYSAPRASNDSDVGKAKNRRVELVIW